jgi:cytochrome P450
MACASLRMADRGCRLMLLPVQKERSMTETYIPFVPPAPVPRTTPPSRFEIIRTVMRNPLELWGEPSFRLEWLKTKFFNERTLIVNHPGLVRHVLVDNAQNYRMAAIRQLVLRPILRDGLLTAEGETWKRSRKAMAPVFTPRHARGFAEQMLKQSLAFKDRYAATADSNAGRGEVHDVAVDMTQLTFDILSATLFSGHVAGSEEEFAGDIERLLSTMGRVDPMDLLKAPSMDTADPQNVRSEGARQVQEHRQAQTMDDRQKMMRDDP